MSQTTLKPVTSEPAVGQGRWMVVIFNNETNTFQEVIEILMRATGCTEEEAYMETWEADRYGKAPVHFAQKAECDVVAAMIGSIGLQTEVCQEWPN